MRGMMYLPRCLSTGISRLVCVQRLPVGTCTILAGDRRGGNVASADVGVERLGKNRRRDEDQDRRCGQNTFHSILLFDVTWSPPSRFPTHVHRVAVNRAGNERTFAFNNPHLTTDRRVQHPTLNDRSATHVFVGAIGTTAFSRFSASGRMQNVRQLCGRSLSAMGQKQTSRDFGLMSALPPIRFLWFPPHANVSRMPYILGPTSGMVIALEEICA